VSPPRRSLVIVIAATALVVVIGIAIWANARDRPTDPLYLQLQAIAVAAPIDPAIPASADVSDKVCAVVDAEKLNQMEFNIGNPLPQNVRYWVVQFNSWLPCLDRNGNRALLIGIDPATRHCHASAVLQRACEFSL